MNYWKEPKAKAWFSFIVDGKCISTNEDSAKIQKEISRLSGLIGVKVVVATKEQLIKVNAKTITPKRILYKMADAAKGRL